MPSVQETAFLKDSAAKAFEPRHRQIIHYTIDKYDTAVQIGLTSFHHIEKSKRKAHIVKSRTTDNLDTLLPEFESNFIRKGGKVIWANDADEAREEIWKIMQRAGAKTVVKSKSMTTEEIGLNDFLEKKGVNTLETDLGEYIVQLL